MIITWHSNFSASNMELKAETHIVLGVRLVEYIGTFE